MCVCVCVLCPDGRYVCVCGVALSPHCGICVCVCAREEHRFIHQRCVSVCSEVRETPKPSLGSLHTFNFVVYHVKCAVCESLCP